MATRPAFGDAQAPALGLGLSVSRRFDHERTRMNTNEDRPVAAFGVRGKRSPNEDPQRGSEKQPIGGLIGVHSCCCA